MSKRASINLRERPARGVTISPGNERQQSPPGTADDDNRFPSLRKRFRLGEFLAEYFIKLIAFISFAVNTLAGVPAIVFGLGTFVQFVGTGMDKPFGFTEPHWGQYL